jgi:hypothetical protein
MDIVHVSRGHIVNGLIELGDPNSIAELGYETGNVV